MHNHLNQYEELPHQPQRQEKEEAYGRGHVPDMVGSRKLGTPGKLGGRIRETAINVGRATTATRRHASANTTTTANSGLRSDGPDDGKVVVGDTKAATRTTKVVGRKPGEATDDRSNKARAEVLVARLGWYNPSTHPVCRQATVASRPLFRLGTKQKLKIKQVRWTFAALPQCSYGNLVRGRAFVCMIPALCLSHFWIVRARSARVCYALCPRARTLATLRGRSQHLTLAQVYFTPVGRADDNQSTCTYYWPPPP